MRALVILLSAPLASFGEQAGNAQRGTAERPTRSSLLGLAGAALGIERTDSTRQQALTQSWLLATRTLDSGAPLTDFHTFQSLPTPKGSVSTRAQALARRNDLATSVTRRDYRSGGAWQVAYVDRPDAPISLDTLHAAFLRPHFVLSAGRKSCTLDWPLLPHCIEAADIEQAFLAHMRHVTVHGLTPVTDAGGIIAADAMLPLPPSRNNVQRHRRFDEPEDRPNWHFASRYEHVYPMAAQRLPNPDPAP